MKAFLLLAVVSQTDVVVFSVAILLIFMLFVSIFFISMWLQRHQAGVSPYSGLPLRRASDLPLTSAEKILRYFYDMHQYDNRIFSLKKAAFCRETGRVFQNCITWYGTVKVDWNFLQKRYPGNYISWGSINDIQKEAIIEAHDSLEGFQTDYSSPNASPRAIEPEYAYSKPGPLYVDLDTKVLIGWKIVPGTDFEVLIVQLPRKQYKY